MTTFHVYDGDPIYIMVPNNLENGAEAILQLDSSLEGKTIRISVIDDDSKLPLYSGDVQYFGNSDIRRVEYVDDDTIPGHPNCRYGECGTCKVVSCGIYQGYEEVPVRPTRYYHG